MKRFTNDWLSLTLNPNCVPYNSYDVSLEELILDQLIIV